MFKSVGLPREAGNKVKYGFDWAVLMLPFSDTAPGALAVSPELRIPWGIGIPRGYGSRSHMGGSDHRGVFKVMGVSKRALNGQSRHCFVLAFVV